MMDFSGQLFDKHDTAIPPLLLAVGGSCVVLVLCLLPVLLRRDQSLSGEACRPDEPYPGRAEATITSLRVYPVKSCAGHEVQEAKLGKRGLEMDRLWMVVDGSGRFMSQRRYSKMALVTPSLPESFHEPLLLSAPGMPSVEVPIMHEVGPKGPEAGGRVVDVQIWRDTCRAVDQGDAVASWLSEFLGVENLRLVRMQDKFVRPTDSRYGTGFSTGFADGFPILLTAEESLEELNSRMAKEEAVGMERFRPNIVVRGWGAFAEDGWTKIKAGGIAMRTPKPCGRCRIPSINQTTLERRAEPQVALGAFRSGSQVAQWEERWSKDVFFGMNALHEKTGVLRVGDAVEVLRVAKARNRGTLKET